MKGFEFLMGKPPPDEKPKETHVKFLKRAIKELDNWLSNPESRTARLASVPEGDSVDDPYSRGLSGMIDEFSGNSNEEDVEQRVRRQLQEYRNALAGTKGRLESELERLKNELEEIQKALLENNRQQSELEQAAAQDESGKRKLRALQKNADTLKSSALRKNAEIIACQKELSELTDT